MLGLCVVLLLVNCALAGQPWPFTLVDKFMEDFNARVDNVVKVADTYKFHEESFGVRSGAGSASVALKHAEHYDFIIVGGGTSGSVLAARLSEIPEWKILVLEAGGVEDDATKVPKNWKLLHNTPFNWGYKTTPQNYSCLAMEDHECIIPTGRVLGGTSAINSMVYTRGNPRDYDLWADHDNKGWCFDDVISYFKKIENAEIVHFDKKYHRLGGPQSLQNPQYSTGLAEHAIKAGEEVGLHEVDYNGKHQLGIGLPQLTTYCGKRSSTADSYLEKALKRGNLVIKPKSQVLRVLVSPHTKEAQGVEYLYDGHVMVAKADKEVVLSAGALNTPKILILSGIGPKDECLSHKIDNIVDLKVGHNLKVRPTIALPLVYEKHHHEHEHEHEHEAKELSHEAIMTEYLKAGKGPLTSPGVEAIAYIKSGHDKIHPDNYPNIELQFVSDHHNPKILVTLNHPRSRGIVKLHDSDPLHHPIIEPHLLADEDDHDFKTLLAGVKDALKIVRTKSFEKLGLVLDDKPVHGCEDEKFDSDYYWKCAIKYETVPTSDVSGTTKMGPLSDEDAVVDNTLKVRHLHRLRVADTSVIPVTMTGNLMGPSILIGEKAAHLIIEDWEE